MDKDKYSMILNYISDGIMEVDKSGRIVYCNLKSAMLDDIKFTDIKGKYLLDIYPSLDKNSSTILKVLETGTAMHNVEQTYINYKGKSITTINTTLPLLEKGNVTGAVEISSNITDVKIMSEKIVDLQNIVHKKKRNQEYSVSDVISYDFKDIITNNSEMHRIKSMGMKAAMTSSHILVVGETGTGKELLVQSIHRNSSRGNGTFIAQNCAALPHNLLEGILFGTTKGSFTGSEERIGLFELADGGTVFLDEINSMPLELQAKLLRFIQDNTIRRIGGTNVKRVDVRIIAASNMDPQLAVDRKLLREDLYYRLNTITLRIPALKERKDDIPLLTEHFIKKYNSKLHRDIKGITAEVASLFQKYDWRGNVRELEHVLEGTMSMIDSNMITIDDLPLPLKKVYEEPIKSGPIITNITDLKASIETFEKKVIELTYNKYSQNITQTAKSLGIPRQTLQYKLGKYKIIDSN